MLKDLGVIPNEPLAHFSQIQMNWMQNECPPCDWFVGPDFPFIWVHGFSEEPFWLPYYVTGRTLAFEMARQLVRIKGAVGAGKHDTSIAEDNKAIGPITLVRRKIAKEILMSKMAQLGFVVIDDSWSYDPDDCLSKRKNVVRHEPQNSWAERTNPRVDDPNLYVGPNDFPVFRYPPWLKFYSPL